MTVTAYFMKDRGEDVSLVESWLSGARLARYQAALRTESKRQILCAAALEAFAAYSFPGQAAPAKLSEFFSAEKLYNVNIPGYSHSNAHTRGYFLTCLAKGQIPLACDIEEQSDRSKEFYRHFFKNRKLAIPDDSELKKTFYEEWLCHELSVKSDQSVTVSNICFLRFNNCLAGIYSEPKKEISCQQISLSGIIKALKIWLSE